MLKIPRHICAIAALVLIYSAWINWWASSGFPFEGEICEIAHPAENCGSHNVFFYSAYRLASISNQWSALIAAAATIAIAWFTLTLKKATAKLGEQQSNETKIIQRAYLAVKPHGIRPVRSDPTKLVGYIGIINVGNLPARNVRTFVSFKYANGDYHNDFPLGLPDGTKVAAPGIVLRKGSQVIDKSELNKVSKEKLFFYVWGIVYYHDGFVDDRHIMFCHRYRWEVFGEPEGRLSAPAKEARYHEYGNGTDEDLVSALRERAERSHLLGKA
jgi:hypothetical protein